MLASAIYEGRVTHSRRRPRAHRLAYRIFMLLIDLDELESLDRRLRFFSAGRFNLTGLRPRHHGDGSSRALQTQVEAHLEAAGLGRGGPIWMLAMPAILGHGFNPLTVYFCHDADGVLSAILYEVNNTFGERHSYLIPAGRAEVVRQSCDKRFYVSPFMDMALTYRFRVRVPDAALQVLVDVDDADGPLMATGFTAVRRQLTDRALVSAWLRHPWMTVGVLAAIHWEALKIWLKGERLRPRPRGPDRPVTLVG